MLLTFKSNSPVHKCSIKKFFLGSVISKRVSLKRSNSKWDRPGAPAQTSEQSITSIKKTSVFQVLNFSISISSSNGGLSGKRPRAAFPKVHPNAWGQRTSVPKSNVQVLNGTLFPFCLNTSDRKQFVFFLQVFRCYGFPIVYIIH